MIESQNKLQTEVRKWLIPLFLSWNIGYSRVIVQKVTSGIHLSGRVREAAREEEKT